MAVRVVDGLLCTGEDEQVVHGTSKKPGRDGSVVTGVKKLRVDCVVEDFVVPAPLEKWRTTGKEHRSWKFGTAASVGVVSHDRSEHSTWR